MNIHSVSGILPNPGILANNITKLLMLFYFFFQNPLFSGQRKEKTQPVLLFPQRNCVRSYSLNILGFP
ncbi:MAG TPA: hypothetical protein DDW86_02790 [Clostridiales bacterium]|nr:hypothetical protein [Clostridiales bacterium]